MKDRMMLGEKDFQKAVLVVLLILMTLICLHIFVTRSDAAGKSAPSDASEPTRRSKPW